MKILWSWLQDHMSICASVDHVMDALTHSGTEAEKTEAYPWTTGFQVAEVLSTVPHPNAESLKVCQVHLGQGQTVSIVCGADNVRPGLKTIVALPGCFLPGSTTPLSVCTLRGVTSHGMLCSAQELSMQDIWGQNDGLVELPESLEIGTPLRHFLPQDDVILDLNVTPNRGDLFSHRGIARELMALGLGFPLEGAKKIGSALEMNLFDSMNPALIDVALETALCPFFQLCRIENVQQGQTAPWIKRRLIAVSSSCHGPCVDISNYAAEDNGQPLHVFDAEAIQGLMRIRTSQAGESFQALNGETYTLPQGLVVISDDGGILSLAGIMGGMRGRCQQETRHVLLEAACFDPTIIARGGKMTRLNSTSKSRFERGVDPDFCASGLNLAALEMVKQTGGMITGVSRIGAIPRRKPIAWDMGTLEKRCAVVLPQTEIVHRLEKWGALVETIHHGAEDRENQGSLIQVTPPSWRWDWQDSWDCITETLRGQGYTEVPSTPLSGQPILASMQQDTGAVLPSLNYALMWALRDFWIARGLYEVVTWSFMSTSMAKPFFQGSEDTWQDLQLQNPLSKEWSVLRPSLLPALVSIQHYHQKYGLAFQPIFEIGPRFLGLSPEDQQETLTALWPIKKSDVWSPENPSAPKTWSFYDIKSMIDASIAALGIAHTHWEPLGPPWYHPGQSARLMQHRPDGTIIELAVIGKLHPRLNISAWGAELHLNAWHGMASPPMYAIPSLQPVSKDLSFYMPHQDSIGPVIEKIKNLPMVELVQVMITDIFREKESNNGSNQGLMDSLAHDVGGVDIPNQPTSNANHALLYSMTMRCVFQPGAVAFSSDDLQSLMHQVAVCAQSNGWVLRGTLDDPKKGHHGLDPQSDRGSDGGSDHPTRASHHGS